MRRNFVTISQQLASIPADVLAANGHHSDWLANLGYLDEEIIQSHCAQVTAHLASQGEAGAISVTSTISHHHQVMLGACLVSPISCAGLLFDILDSRALEPYLPQHFVRHMLQELGIGVTSLIQLSATFHEQHRGN